MISNSNENGKNKDQELIEKVKEGDIEAFNRLVTKYQKRIYRLVLYITGDHDLTDEVTQEIFLRVYQYSTQFDGRSSFYTWLYRIAVNTARSHVKKKSLESIDPSDPRVAMLSSKENNPEELVARKEKYLRLLKAIEELPEELRITVMLVSIEGLSHKEVAEITGCAEGTVSWRMFQARKILWEKLKDMLKN